MAVRYVSAPDELFPYVPRADTEIDRAAQAEKAWALLQTTSSVKERPTDLELCMRAWWEYLETRDEGWLCLKNPEAATRFAIMPLSEAQTSEFKQSLDKRERHRLAFDCGVRGVTNFADKVGVVSIDRGADGRVTQATKERVRAPLVQEVGEVVLIVSGLSSRFREGA